MDTITIHSVRNFSLDAIERALSNLGVVENYEGKQLVVNGTKSRAYVYVDSTVEESHTLHIDYSEVDLAKAIIETIADDPFLVVDNDFDTVLPGDQFVERIRNEEGWNWRNGLDRK